MAAAVAHILSPVAILGVSMPLGLAGAALALAVPAAGMHGAAAWANATLLGLGLSTAFANVLSLLVRAREARLGSVGTGARCRAAATVCIYASP